MKIQPWTLLLLASLVPIVGAGKDDAAKKTDEDTVFREPFTLKLQIDKKKGYEEKFGKIPYVHNGAVYLFKGEEFGLNLDIQDNTVRSVKYQPDLTKADVTLKFRQDVQDDGKPMMLLTIRNNTKQTLGADALMTVPKKKAVVRTSILPIGAGMSGYESWPHPIVQLVLGKIRVEK